MKALALLLVAGAALAAELPPLEIPPGGEEMVAPDALRTAKFLHNVGAAGTWTERALRPGHRGHRAQRDCQRRPCRRLAPGDGTRVPIRPGGRAGQPGTTWRSSRRLSAGVVRPWSHGLAGGQMALRKQVTCHRHKSILS